VLFCSAVLAKTVSLFYQFVFCFLCSINSFFVFVDFFSWYQSRLHIQPLSSLPNCKTFFSKLCKNCKSIFSVQFVFPASSEQSSAGFKRVVTLLRVSSLNNRIPSRFYFLLLIWRKESPVYIF
jgi:hypothetical protein